MSRRYFDALNSCFPQPLNDSPSLIPPQLIDFNLSPHSEPPSQDISLENEAQLSSEEDQVLEDHHQEIWNQIHQRIELAQDQTTRETVEALKDYTMEFSQAFNGNILEFVLFFVSMKLNGESWATIEQVLLSYSIFIKDSTSLPTSVEGFKLLLKTIMNLTTTNAIQLITCSRGQSSFF
jgi:hypothetical protein